MLSPDRQAGLVLALSTLAVVTAMAVVDLFRAPLTISVVDGASVVVAGDEPPTPTKSTPAPVPLRAIAFPLSGIDRNVLRDNFDDRRGKRRHGALDIMAPRGTPVVAVDDGSVAKMYHHPLGGNTIYQMDPRQERVYYYAHLDGYAKGLREGATIKRGDVVGFVGSTGNAPERAPHLHFAIFRLGADKRWWKGEPVNPYPLLKE
ncbi:MAG TPA: M23 family metallopeptidase [Usitatibacter sp.]|nr:M23 family metallopeptidase [Usitatibacter sp.]